MRRLPLRSPPRVRGKAEVRHERDQEPGITPACAGKRHCPRFRPGKTRDHPRVCGEKSSLMQMDVGPLGSPTRMRGKGELPKDTKDYFGITPAYAGKRFVVLWRSVATWDHPRVCGEEACMQCTLQGHGGSPPRMRGRVAAAARRDFLAGITPAYAGKRILSLSVAVRPWDHPRVCGEEHKAFSDPALRRGITPAYAGKSAYPPPPLDKVPGSPPRMRGRAPPHAVKRRPSGITPAYAGKSTRSTIRLLFAMGSPPRMRGRGFEYVKQYGEAGITPAYAGKRIYICRNPDCGRDHPRVCGEEFRVRQLYCLHVGSPPRMRGRVDIAYFT